MKYKLTENTKIIYDIILHQIKNLETGELGGWIESEKNLSQHDKCWVSGNARVYGNAQVSGNAWVSGDARVYGNAQVSGNACVSDDARVYGDAHVSGDARVYGDAHVSGDAWVSGNARVSGDSNIYGKFSESPLQIQGTRHFVCVPTVGRIRIGCIDLPIAEWLEKGEKIGKKNNYTDKQIAEYKKYIQLAKDLF